jgi:WD40 repeat protein
LPVHASASTSPASAVKYQFSITLPDFVSPTGVKLRDLPASMEWSPDNHQLAVVGFNSGKVHLFDIQRQHLIHSDISWTLNPPRIVWSPDSRMIAVIGIDIVLFSATDGKELKRTKIQ